ncbi:MAG: family 16 glycoside hydrolase [Myxococcota bacterium]
MTRLCRYAALATLVGCTPQGDPGIGARFSDSFERDKLGDHWERTHGAWAIEDGQVHARGARNHPLWLKRRIPRDVRIEFDARSDSADGDIKVEVFGDGVSFASTDRYVASGYVIILGGWGNSRNVLARMDEHGADRIEGPPIRVEPRKTYRVRIEREGPRLSVFVDDALLLAMTDPDPLEGRGHDHFGFNNWQSDLWFDNLRITPL